MIFEALFESSKRGELILKDGGLCHWHLVVRGKRRGQITIREIISQRPGVGQEMLAILKDNPKATSLFAKCPADLPANEWYEKQGFTCEGEETAKTGRKVILWRLVLRD